MNAELIAIGSELVCGAGLDTNSQWLSQELEARGWTVTRHTTIADDLDAMVETLQLAARRCRIVLVTGGLGPTRDDITREAMSGAFNQPLVEDETELQYITGMFARLGRPMPDRNRIQAMRPRDATPLRNNHGTAPGVLLNVASPKCMIAAMPGVPGEMKKMFDEQLVAMLAKHVDDLKLAATMQRLQHILCRIEQVFGKTEQTMWEFTNCGVRHRQD